MALHQGVVVPLVTPATADGRLDRSAAERLVEHVVGGGCGVMACGTTGEVASLPDEVRIRYVETVVRVAARRAPVFACIAHNCLSSAITLAHAHFQAGVDAVVAMLPNYFKLDPPEMARYFRQLATACPGPVYLYNMPVTTGMSLPVEVLAELAEVPNIVGLKDSETTAGRREAVAAALGQTKDFGLFMGSAAASAAALRLGFHGLVPSSGNLRPTLWRDLFAAAQAGDWVRVDALQKQTDAFAAVYQKGRTLGQSLAALKSALGDLGLVEPHMYSPLMPLASSERDLIREQLLQFP